MKFSQKILLIGDFGKLSFFESAIASSSWIEILTIALVSSQKSLNPKAPSAPYGIENFY